jgi:hypothetical protein
MHLLTHRPALSARFANMCRPSILHRQRPTSGNGSHPVLAETASRTWHTDGSWHGTVRIVSCAPVQSAPVGASHARSRFLVLTIRGRPAAITCRLAKTSDGFS